MQDLSKQRLAIASKLMSSKIFNVIDIVSTFWDMGSFFYKLYTDEVSPLSVIQYVPAVSLLPYAMLSMVFEFEFNKMIEAMELAYFEGMYNYNDLLNWKGSSSYDFFEERNVYVQYVDKKEKYNYTVPTSIKFLNKDIAVDVFGFMPNYVNYDFPQEGNFNPKYYLPFQ